MIVLDTNVLSALMRDVPEKEVEDWLDRQPRTSIWTTSITVFELYFGLQIMAAGKRRSALGEKFELLIGKFDGRIAALDSEAAQRAAELMAARRKEGRSVELRDTMIAGIVLSHHASLATRNVTHFEDAGVPLINPWEA
ncbi:MAG: type II toxin-antitoxin system VapC family toxin [Candidatus Korobacteraceae bacterium]